LPGARCWTLHSGRGPGFLKNVIRNDIRVVNIPYRTWYLPLVVAVVVVVVVVVVVFNSVIADYLVGTETFVYINMAK
jgi:hypothetical protein